MIKVSNITKVYGKKANAFTALSDVSFDIEDGSTVSIMGKSGSGKSTLMHIMSGLDHPDTGEVIFGDKNLFALSRRKIDLFRAKVMSFIFQAFFVEPNQTCYQNVALPLEIAGIKKSRRRAMILDALEKVELSDKIDSRARDLSGGQKQRLAIARAIVLEPKLIFADEPTGNLDSTTGELIIDLLFDLNKTLGSTLIVVTHDEDLASRCQTQIVLMDGKIASIKSNKPAKRKTA